MQALIVPDSVRSSLRPGDDLSRDDLVRLYLADAAPRHGRAWLRTNFVATLDGAATGADGRSGSINTDADHVVFDLLRAVSDVLIVGAGTLDTERYSDIRPAEEFAGVRRELGLDDELPLVCVSNRGRLPERLAGDPNVWLATAKRTTGLGRWREELDGRVIVAGSDAVHLPTLVADLVARGWRRLLCEGGPHLHASLVDEGLVDELCLTTSPMIVGGSGPTVTAGQSLSATARPLALVEHDGSIMGRWLVT